MKKLILAIFLTPLVLFADTKQDSGVIPFASGIYLSSPKFTVTIYGKNGAVAAKWEHCDSVFTYGNTVEVHKGDKTVYLGNAMFSAEQE